MRQTKRTVLEGVIFERFREAAELARRAACETGRTVEVKRCSRGWLFGVDDSDVRRKEFIWEMQELDADDPMLKSEEEREWHESLKEMF
jgi:hypothetical protein